MRSKIRDQKYETKNTRSKIRDQNQSPATSYVAWGLGTFKRILRNALKPPIPYTTYDSCYTVNEEICCHEVWV